MDSVGWSAIEERLTNGFWLIDPLLALLGHGFAMKFEGFARCCMIAMLGIVFVGATLALAATEEPYKVQIDGLRKAMEKYKDYKVAVRDLYLSTVGCVHYSSEKITGYMEYPKGAMCTLSISRCEAYPMIR